MLFPAFRFPPFAFLGVLPPCPSPSIFLALRIRAKFTHCLPFCTAVPFASPLAWPHVLDRQVLEAAIRVRRGGAWSNPRTRQDQVHRARPSLPAAVPVRAGELRRRSGDRVRVRGIRHRGRRPGGRRRFPQLFRERLLKPRGTDVWHAVCSRQHSARGFPLHIFSALLQCFISSQLRSPFSLLPLCHLRIISVRSFPSPPPCTAVATYTTVSSASNTHPPYSPADARHLA